MASLITTGTEPARLLRDHFEQTLLERLNHSIIAGDLMTSKVIPVNSGTSVDFHRIQNLPLQLAAITQSMGSAHSAIHTTGGNLKGDAYVVDSISATLHLVGNDLQLSELLMITSEPNPVPELMDIFLQNGTATLEQRYINCMVSTPSGTVNGVSQDSTVPSVNYSGSSVSVGTVWGDGSGTLTEATLDADIPSHRLSAESFNLATYRLRADRAPVHSRFGRFAALVSNGQAADLRLDSTFQELAYKGFKMGEAKFEAASLGEVFGCVVMETPFVAVNFPGTVDATNDEIHRGIVFGAGYAARVSHARGVGRPRVSFIPPSPSAADVYGNNGYMSWKAYTACVVLNPVCGQILKSATTNVTSTTGGDNAVWE